MKVILTDDVVGLGDIGEIVRVKPGYARNYLIPRGLALESGASSAQVIAHRMKQIEAKKRRNRISAEDIAARVRNATVETELRVGSGGRVFGAISGKDITAKLAEQGLEIDRRRILLHEPIKKPGTHFVRVKLHPEVEAQLKVIIRERAASKEEEELETSEARARIEEAVEETAAQETAAEPSAEEAQS